MKTTLPLVLVVAHLVLVGEPPLGRNGIAAAAEPPPVKKLDKQLRWRDQVRVLIQPDWHLVRSPRAMEDGLHITALGEPNTSADSLTTVPWPKVGEIQVRASGAGRGALVGGVLLGAAGGAIAGAISSEVGLTPSDPDPGSIAGGIAGGFLIGAVIGGSIGSAFKRWVKIYPR
jgi:hypothetical protein